MKSNKIVLIWLFLLTVVYIFGWTYTYDTDTPLGSDAPSVIDDRIRETKDAVQERNNIDHYWPLTGSQVSDADAGKHRWVQFREPISSPASVNADEGILYTADVSSKAELFWIDEDENVCQITSVGKIEYESINDVNNNNYITAVDNAGTGTVNLIKADANDLAVLPDGTETATNAAPGCTKGIANKKYVDDQILAKIASEVALSAITNQDSESNAMLKSHAYLAATDGFVYAYVQGSGSNQYLKGYVDTDDDPVTGGTLLQFMNITGVATFYGCISFSVAEGEYFEVTTSSTNAAAIYWRSIGTLSEPEDQD